MKKVLEISLRGIFPLLAQLGAILEIFTEKEWADKADDIVFFGLGILAIFFAIFGKKKTFPKFFPLIFLVLALVTKIVTFFIEHDDVKAVNLDYAVIVFMLLGVAINGIFLLFARRKREESE